MAAERDRRLQVRRALRAPVQLMFANGQAIVARSLDISEGGMALVAPRNLRAGLELHVVLALPVAPGQRERFEVSARVAHCVYLSSEDGFRLGAQFNELSASARSMLEGYLGGRPRSGGAGAGG